MTKRAIPPEIQQAGREAYRKGLPRASCPYTKGPRATSHQRREWLKGYDEERHGDAQQQPEAA